MDHLSPRGQLDRGGVVVGGELVPVGEQANLFAGRTAHSGADCRAAIATERASFGPLLFERPDASARIREASVAGTSSTRRDSNPQPSDP